MIRPEAILLIGPTGSGKSPLGEMLQRRGLWGRRCRHFDFGEALRGAVTADPRPPYLTERDAAFLQQVLETGALLEDEHFGLAERILRAFLAEAGLGGTDLVVLNGLPRHASQADDVGSFLSVRMVVELACEPAAAAERIRTNAGGDRAARTDDAAEPVAARLETFARRTEPLIAHYRRRGARVESIQIRAETTAEAAWRELSGRWPLPPPDPPERNANDADR